jgi:hypothetical protein
MHVHDLSWLWSTLSGHTGLCDYMSTRTSSLITMLPGKDQFQSPQGVRTGREVQRSYAPFPHTFTSVSSQHPVPAGSSSDETIPLQFHIGAVLVRQYTQSSMFLLGFPDSWVLICWDLAYKLPYRTEPQLVDITLSGLCSWYTCVTITTLIVTAVHLILEFFPESSEAAESACLHIHTFLV